MRWGESDKETPSDETDANTINDVGTLRRFGTLWETKNLLPYPVISIKQEILSKNRRFPKNHQRNQKICTAL